jgi:hypothetical protein
MAYAQYTKCCSPNDYSGPFLGSAAFWAALAASIITGIFDPGAGVLGLILTGIGYCRWWLYGRLVCMGGNQCMIGLALGVYDQSNQSGIGKFDTDYGVNILMAPSHLRDTIQYVGANNTVQGFLLRDQSTTDVPINPNQAQILAMMNSHSNLGFTGEPEPVGDLLTQNVLTQAQATALGLKDTSDFPGWQAGNFYLPGTTIVDSNSMLQSCIVQGVSGNNEPSWSEKVGGTTVDNFTKWSCDGGLPVGTMEVEFEGAGVWDLYNALLAAAVPAAAAAAVCEIPFFGWVACLILILIALAIVGAGMAIGLGDTASPSEADPSIGVIHPGVDVLFVMGTWIYDSAHSGWNELHPVLHCQKIGTVLPSDVIAGDPWKTPINVIFSGRCTTSGSSVQRVDGNLFTNLADGQAIQIGTVTYLIATIADGNNMTLNISAGAQPDPVSWNAAALASLEDQKRVTELVDDFCGLATDANDPATVGAQGLPQNQWVYHPTVDGCTPTSPPPPPPR